MKQSRMLVVISLSIVLSVLAIAIPVIPALANVGILSVSPGSGAPGTSVTISGGGFTAGSTYAINFDLYNSSTGQITSTGIASGSIDTNGSFVTYYTIPSQPAGSAQQSPPGQGAIGTYYFRAITSAGDTSNAVLFHITPKVSLSASIGKGGNPLYISGCGFLNNTAVRVYFDNNVILLPVTDDNGAFNASFNVPQVAVGNHTLYAADTLFSSPSLTFTIVQSITINPTSGPPGTVITITGGGFTANKNITITYDGAPIATVPSALTSDAGGNFSATITAPDGPAKSCTIGATDGIVNSTANFALSTTSSELTWNYATPPPATASSFQLTQNTSASLFAIVPDGQTIFAWDKNAGQLYKSGNAGMNWTTTNVGADINFTGTNNGVNITGNAPIIAIAISPNYAIDTTIITATASCLYSSHNGGQNFQLVNLAPVALTAPIVSIDIAPYFVPNGGTAIMAATKNEIILYSVDYGWRKITDAAFTGGPNAGQPTHFAPGKILTARFSPAYAYDGEILAVVSGAMISPMNTPGTVVETLFANSPWNATVRPANLISTASYTSGGISTNNIIANSSTATAAFAFPRDYYSSSPTLNRVYVTIGDASGNTGAPGNSANVFSNGFDVWRINGSINSSGTIVNATQLKLTDATSPANNASLAYTGTAAHGTLVVGMYGTAGVWYNTSPNIGTTWTQAYSFFVPGSNVGKDVFLAFPPASGANPTTLYAATNNNTIVAGRAWGSAFFSSTDYNSFKALSLISVPDLTKISLSQPTGPVNGTQDQYLMVTCNFGGPATVTLGDIQMIFKSTDDGATWAEVFGLFDTITGNNTPGAAVTGQALNNICPSPTYSTSTDNTVYVTQTDKTIWKTTDGGATWNPIISTTPNNSVSAFGVIDANTYWLGSTQGGIYKSGSYTQVATLDGTIPSQIFNLPFGVVVNTWTGEVYISTDQGATFIRLGNLLQFSNGNTAVAGPPPAVPTYINDRASLAFDIPNHTIYAANSPSTASSVIYKWTVGVDTSWVNWCNISNSNYTNPAGVTTLPNFLISSLILAPDDTLYIRVPNIPGAPQLLRCVNLTAQGQQAFNGIAGTTNKADDFNNGVWAFLPESLPGLFPAPLPQGKPFIK